MWKNLSSCCSLFKIETTSYQAATVTAILEMLFLLIVLHLCQVDCLQNQKYLPVINGTDNNIISNNQAKNVSTDLEDVSLTFAKRGLKRNTSDSGNYFVLDRKRKFNVLTTDHCPGGTTYNDRCFWNGGARTWDQCESYCSSQGWRMICVDSATTNAFLVSTFSGVTYGYFAIGLNDKVTAGSYVWSGGCSPPDYRNWEVTQPGGGPERCIAFARTNGQWHDITCSEVPGIACGCESSWTFEPTAHPTNNPTHNPTKNPTNNPTKSPTKNPTNDPTEFPTLNPSQAPTKNPTVNPTARPTPNPTFTPTCVPTSQPSQQPSSQPSNQPSTQSSSQPSAQPSRQPTRQPTAQPITGPTSQPSRQPNAQPSKHPSAQPSRQPTAQPTHQPSAGPSSQPAAHPSMQPSRQPSLQPSSKPSIAPSMQPTSQPSVQPSWQPSAQPSRQPSLQPSGQPYAVPSLQPMAQPTSQPTVQPSRQPSSSPSAQPRGQQHPTAQPSDQPFAVPSSQPSRQPTLKPSQQPTKQPTRQPTVQPSNRPSLAPSSQPSEQPSTQPSMQPTLLPSVQPSIRPSRQPSAQPSSQPTTAPSMQPSAKPSVQPSAKPSVQPSRQPTAVPTTQSTQIPSSQPSVAPSAQPSELPTMLPTIQPSGQPTSNPSRHPSAQPINKPSVQPSSHPSAQPSIQPSTQPTSQPSRQPSLHSTNEPSAQPSYYLSTQPSIQPSTQPTAQPTYSPNIPVLNGEWLAEVETTGALNQITYANNTIWACGTQNSQYNRAFCYKADGVTSTKMVQYLFPWTDFTSIINTDNPPRLFMVGRVWNDSDITSTISTCTKGILELCELRSLSETNIVAGSHVAFAKKNVYIGTYKEQVFATIIDVETGAFRSFLYSALAMKTVIVSHLQSPPKFVGTFVAGTCVSAASVNYIYAGMIRTDSGIMTAMYMMPAGGRIMNSAELVNAMALENVKPDSFIAGGLQLNDGRGMHAYLLRVNSFFNSVEYGTRYIVRRVEAPLRQLTQIEQSIHESVVKGAALDGGALFMIINVIDTLEAGSKYSVHIAKVDIATGSILQQVQIESSLASLQCTDIVTSGATAVSKSSYLYISCTIQSTNSTSQGLLLSTNSDLSFSALPPGFRRYDNETLRAEQVAFNRVMLPLTVNSADLKSADSTYTATNVNPTRQPSKYPTSPPNVHPSSIPSSQPSSSPTAAPSVSPEPTSQPSSSGPTNTYKPTVKPTPGPSVMPSTAPTQSPTVIPSLQPTKSPSITPSNAPSIQPSVSLTPPPTTVPTVKPSRKPSMLPTVSLTSNPTNVGSPAAGVIASGYTSNSKDDALFILLYVVSGLVGLWLVHRIIIVAGYARDKRERTQKMRAEIDHIQLLYADVPTHNLQRVRENKSSHIGGRCDQNPINEMRGAHAVGTRVASRSDEASSSSSIVLSSLHSSEISELSYSVYSDELQSESYFSQSQSQSRESAMEEGCSNSIVYAEEDNLSGLNDQSFSNSCGLKSSGGSSVSRTAY